MNREFSDAIDQLNKIAYMIIDGNAKAWAILAVKKGIITFKDCARIEQLVDLRNTMDHGNAQYIKADLELVNEVKKYIDVVDKSAEYFYSKSRGCEKNAEINPLPFLDFWGIKISPRDIEYFSCLWGDKYDWPVIKIKHRGDIGSTTTTIVIDNDLRVYGDKVFQTRKTEDKGDREIMREYLREKAFYLWKVLNNGVCPCFYFDGLIIPKNKVKNVELNRGDKWSDYPVVVLTLFNGKVLKSIYTYYSTDCTGLTFKDYHSKGSVGENEALLAMAKTDFYIYKDGLL